MAPPGPNTTDRRRFFNLGRQRNQHAAESDLAWNHHVPHGHHAGHPAHAYAWSHQQQGHQLQQPQYPHNQVPVSRRQANQAHVQQEPRTSRPRVARDPATYGVLDNWFYYGSGNRAVKVMCGHCGDGGHAAEQCPKNGVICQYCNHKLPFTEICDHQLSCPKRVRKCMTCQESFSLNDFFTHASACRVRYAKGERVRERTIGA